MELGKTERIEDLEYKGLKIIQDKNLYCFTSDSVILANFVKTRPKDIVVDVGTGSAVIPILVSAKNNLQKIYGIEVQREMYDLARKNIKINDMVDIIELKNQSLQEFATHEEYGFADVVISNPPYKKAGASFHNDNKVKAIARHEIELNLKELCKYSSKILKYGGKFYIVYDANRFAELIYELKENKLEPKKMFFTQSGLNKNPTLVIIESVKNGKEGVKVLPVLITNDKNGDYLKEIQYTYKRG